MQMKGNHDDSPLIERFNLLNLRPSMAPLASSIQGPSVSLPNHLLTQMPTCSQQAQMLPPQRPRINRGSSFTNRVNRVTDEYRSLVPKLSNLNFASTLPHRTTFHEVIPPFPGSDSMPTLGMRDVASWLKSLRLHKYTALFQEMAYDQMMSLDENTLEQRNVTKGARKKILQSIEKLIQRPAILRENEQMLFMGAGKRCVNCAIACLRQTLGTPIRPYGSINAESLDTPCIKIPDQNLPSMLCRLLFHVHCLVFCGGLQAGREDLEDEYLFMLLNVYDRILSNEAFTAAQKEQVLEWKKEARKFVSPAELRRHRVNTPHTTKCDSCLKENQERTRSEQRTIYRNLVSVRAIANLPSLPKGFFDLDLTAQYVVANQQLILLLMQGQQGLLQQQQQKEQEILNKRTQVFQPPPSTNYMNTFNQPQPPVRNSNHPLFGPQPQSRSGYGLGTPIESTLSTTPRPIQGQSSIHNQPRYFNEQPFTLPEVRQANSLFSDSLQMPIGTWNGAAAEEAKKRLYEPFSPCDSTSGYSSSGSERGGSRGSAASPESLHTQRRALHDTTPNLLKADIPQVDVNWIYGHGAH
ncbi:unnamed protein product, partial [Mesorhabditis belari]|uniref:SAM domain-containing protein n=1 Tax=Mesorhabditis belari TaxID=2138241 RepID=A0AAF3EWD4_9BILA